MEAVVVARPLPALALLVPAVFDRQAALATKLLVVDSLVGAGARLAETNHPELGKFVALAVGGLSAGGGGAWGGLRVQGLEGALLAQVVRGAGALVRLGARCPGWEGAATDYLELVVAVAGRGRGPVVGAVLAGLGGVAAVVPPRALRQA